MRARILYRSSTKCMESNIAAKSQQPWLHMPVDVSWCELPLSLLVRLDFLVLVKDVTTIVTRALGGPELARRNLPDKQLVDLRVRPSGVVGNEEEGEDNADDRPAGKPE